MSQIKQVLQLKKAGKGIKTIVRELDMNRNTVKAYLRKVALMKEDINTLLRLDDPVLEARFHAGNPAYLDMRFEDLKTRLDKIVRDLGNKKNHLTKHLAWEEYIQEYPLGYRYSQFCYHVGQHQNAVRPSMVLWHVAGEKLLVDFAGDKISYVDTQSGEIIWCQVFVATLAYSDYSFAMAVRSQSIDDFTYALSCCLNYLGGVPQVVVSDNLKASVIRPSRYEPAINRVMEDMGNHYGFTVTPARVYKPRDKALVENQVRLIYNRVYAKLRNCEFHSLESLNHAIAAKNREHTQTRMQQHPFSREERFLADEKQCLNPLPETAFEKKYYKTLKVAKNNHIYLSCDKHYYSVPFAYTGSMVEVIYTRSMVRIYAKGEKIATHPRAYSPGKYSTEKTHLCSHHKHYLDRSPEYYIKQATGKTELLGQLVGKLFEQTERHPEQLYRSCDGLLQLQRKTDKDTFDRACTIAIESGCFTYSFVRNVIENNMTKQPSQSAYKPLPEHENIRGKEYYEQLTMKF